MEYMLVLGVGIICAIAGLGAGYVIGKVGDQETKEQDKATPEHQQPQSKYPADTLHIWRDNTSQKLVLQIGDRSVQAMEPLTPNEKRFIKPLLTYLQRWVEGAAPTQTPQPTAQPSAQMKPVSKVIVRDTETETPETAEEGPKPKSIVAQIDDILQEKLSTSPLKDRGIRLMETLHGGMTIYIGFDSYSEIEDIPDNDIVAIIRASVKAWEHQQRV